MTDDASNTDSMDLLLIYFRRIQISKQIEIKHVRRRNKWIDNDDDDSTFGSQSASIRIVRILEKTYIYIVGGT